MSLIENQIEDRRFTNLIRKSLKAGYFEFKEYKANITGTPQGSIISPILANIYMNEFDKFILKLKNDFDIGNKSPRTKQSRNIEYQIKKAREIKDINKYKELIKFRNTYPALDFSNPSYKQLAYVRYGDDFLVGIKGSWKEAEKIKEKISVFLNELGLTLNEDKTKITNINIDRVLFLGT